MNELIHRQNLMNNGFTVINQVFSYNEIQKITDLIDRADQASPLFRRTSDLFAIRQVLKEVPQLRELILLPKLLDLLKNLYGEQIFIVKSIYFDKPGNSNWFVAYHQDLTISVNCKSEVCGYGPWTVKHNQYAVQPPLNLLERNFTVRIHLDNTDENNGALKVLAGSHRKGIYRPENINWTVEREVACNVESGGVMIMKPLLLHASNRTTDNRRRRVLHIEFSDTNLPEPLEWSEKMGV